MSSDATLAQLFLVRHALAPDSPTGDARLEEAARQHFSGNDRLRPSEQLEIYREQFWLRHAGSLLEDFPGLAALIGERAWDRLVERFLTTHPPSDVGLRELGAALPDFVERSSELPHAVIARDMARLEWAYLECFDAADSPPLDAARLGSFSDDDWSRARIELAPSLRLLEASHGVADLRRRIRTHSAPEPLEDVPDPEPHYLVVYRQTDGSLWDKSLTLPAFRLLQAFHDGLSLIPACERVVAACPEAVPAFEEHLTGWFSTWGRLGWVHDVRVPTEPQ